MKHIGTEYCYTSTLKLRFPFVPQNIRDSYNLLVTDQCKKKYPDFIRQYDALSWDKLIKDETKNFSCLSYYIQEYDLSIEDVFRNAGYSYSLQSEKERKLAIYLSSCSDKQYQIIQEFIDSSTPPAILCMDRNELLNHGKRTYLAVRTYPCSRTRKQQLLTEVENLVPNTKTYTLSRNLSMAAFGQITLAEIYYISQIFNISFSWLLGISIGKHSVFASSEIDYLCAKYTLLPTNCKNVIESWVRGDEL